MVVRRAHAWDWVCSQNQGRKPLPAARELGQRQGQTDRWKDRDRQRPRQALWTPGWWRLGHSRAPGWEGRGGRPGDEPLGGRQDTDAPAPGHPGEPTECCPRTARGGAAGAAGPQLRARGRLDATDQTLCLISDGEYVFGDLERRLSEYFSEDRKQEGPRASRRAAGLSPDGSPAPESRPGPRAARGWLGHGPAGPQGCRWQGRPQGAGGTRRPPPVSPGRPLLPVLVPAARRAAPARPSSPSSGCGSTSRTGGS